MMDNHEIKTTVTRVLTSVLRKEIRDEQVPFVELGADELDLFEFVLKIEDAFMLEISDTDATQLTTIEKTVAYIAARKE
jgi:acyl carrier protein